MSAALQLGGGQSESGTPPIGKKSVWYHGSEKADGTQYRHIDSGFASASFASLSSHSLLTPQISSLVSRLWSLVSHYSSLIPSL